MAIIRNNNFLKGASGLVGDSMVFKSWNGKTYLFSKSQPAKKQSEKQKENRSKFREATVFAKSMMADPKKKAEYKAIAKRLKLPNAYTAAITEYMRRPEIKSIDATKYRGLAGQEIRVEARKKDFDIESVDIMIYNGDGKLIEEGKMSKKGTSNWKYRTKESLTNLDGLQVLVRVRDKVDSVVELRKLL